MQTLYIADLPLPGDAALAWQAAEQAIDTWARERQGLPIDPDGVEHRNGTFGTLGRSTLLADEQGSKVRTWRVRKVDPGKPLWAYDVTVWTVLDRSGAEPRTSVRVRLGAHALHGRVAELPQPPLAPGVVHTLLDEHDVTADGHRLGIARDLAPTDVASLVEHLIDEGRRRPTLVISGVSPDGETVIDPSRTARRLAGLAHVVTLRDREASHALADGLGGPGLSVYGGAARLYWPGLRLDGRSNVHPIWLPQRLLAGGTTHFAAHLFARLGRLSALTLDAPELEARLTRKQRALLKAEEAERFAAASLQANEALRELEALRSSARPDDEPAAGVDDDWFDQYDETLEELERVATERDDLQTENEQLRQELDVAEANIKAMAIATAAREQPTSDDDEDGLLSTPEPRTVEQAVELAASLCSHLTFLPEAYSSARDSEYPNPQRVLDDLLAIDEVARAWARDELPSGGFEVAFVEAGISCFRSGISATARNQYARDYERGYDGKTITLGPHLARGTGPIKTILRIYWYLDVESRALVVGHVGKKLRDDSNP